MGWKKFVMHKESWLHENHFRSLILIVFLIIASIPYCIGIHVGYENAPNVSIMIETGILWNFACIPFLRLNARGHI